MAGLRAAGAALVAVLASQQPVFRSRVDVVTVDVTVVGAGGAPIQGLQADRFDVSVDGVKRRVLWVEYVSRDTSPSPPVSGGHFTSNQQAGVGRLLLIAVDQLHIRRVEGLAALKAASAFVDALDGEDRVAAAPLNHTGPIEFTTDHASVKRYVQKLTGSGTPTPMPFAVGLTEALAISDGSRTRLDQVVLRECGQPLGRLENPARVAEAGGMRDPCPNQVEQESRALAQQARTEARLSVDALGRLIARLAEIDGPKTLVLVSEGLIAEPQLVDLTALGGAAQAARVTIYVLQLETPQFDAADSTVSPTMQADREVQADGLARLAGSARGALFRLVGDDPYPFRRIMRELSGYYLLGFEASDADRDGQTHAIGVSVRADGATVRARPAFRIAPAPPVATESDLVRLLRSNRSATELPLRVAAYVFRDAPTDRLKVMLSAETDGGGASEDAAVGFVLIDAAGVIVASPSGRTDRGRFALPVVVPAGHYELRAAAIDAVGRRGSVIRSFEARLGGGPAVQVSDLMLSEAPTASTPVRPMVVRAGGEKILAYLEAYAQAPWTPGNGTSRVDVLADDGARLFSVPVSVQHSGNGRWLLSADVPLRDLPPGSYSLAPVLAFDGAPRVASRTFIVTGR